MSTSNCSCAAQASAPCSRMACREGTCDRGVQAITSNGHGIIHACLAAHYEPRLDMYFTLIARGRPRREMPLYTVPVRPLPSKSPSFKSVTLQASVASRQKVGWASEPYAPTLQLQAPRGNKTHLKISGPGSGLKVSDSRCNKIAAAEMKSPPASPRPRLMLPPPELRPVAAVGTGVAY